jgi:hypothetical protein
MKIFLECPNCHNKTILQSNKSASSNNIKDLLGKKTFCEVCKKNQLGNIELRVIGFDGEREATTIPGSKVPTKLDPVSLSLEQLNNNKLKEKSIK